jgi:YfiH family protein
MTRPAESIWPHGWIAPDWPAPPGVRALMTTRAGGVSAPPWGAAPDVGGGMNLALHTGDDPDHVAANRARLRRLLPGEPVWLEQVHGAEVVDAEWAAPTPTADASVALAPGVVCAVLVADCLPVFVAEAGGRAVAAAHAGWRGLAAGVLQATVARLRARLAAEAGIEDAHLLAWLGPAIGARRFEVGADVLAVMRAALPGGERAFVPIGGDKYLADLYALARLALARAGVVRVYGGGSCTVSDPGRFYSFRRDRRTGRHAALIWREPQALAVAPDAGTAG